MIYLLRHGDAEKPDGDDAARRLTEKGEGQARSAGRALAKLGAVIEACLTSPKVRAAETARLACEPLGIDPETSGELAGGGLDALALGAGRGEVLMVGHEPDFSDEIARLTGGKVRLRKGGLAILDGSTLLGLLGAKELKKIAND